MIQKDIDKIINFERHPPKDNLFLFDIDSTLYNVSPRTEKILKNFCADPKHIEVDPEAVKKLNKILVSSRDWGFAEALIREKFSSQFKLIKLLTEYWRKYFFSNEYIKYDEQYPSAEKYIQKVSKLNFNIKYLTGRSKNLMYEGTIKKFRQDQMPLAKSEDLIMKMTHEPDHIYKLKVIEQLKKVYKNIIFFENEPLIINTILEKHKEVQAVFIDSTHSRKAKLNFDIPIIKMNYEPLI